MVDGLNAIGKRYTYQLMSNVQLQNSKKIDSQILMHSCTNDNDVSLNKQFQKHLYKDHRKNGFIDQGNIEKYPVK